MKLYQAMIAVFLLSNSSVYAAGPSQPVYSLTNKGEMADTKGMSFQLVMVKCNNHDQQRYIHRSKGEQQWCAYGLADKCSSDRIEAAAHACLLSKSDIDLLSSNADDAVAMSDPAQQQQRERLQSELLSLQQQQLELRQRQLDLRKREAELAKRRQQL